MKVKFQVTAGQQVEMPAGMIEKLQKSQEKNKMRSEQENAGLRYSGCTVLRVCHEIDNPVSGTGSRFEKSAPIAPGLIMIIEIF